jgi:hypothetical protein
MKKIIFILSLLALSLGAFAQVAITAEYPKAAISGKSSGDLSVAEIQAAGELTTTLTQLRITHFALTMKSGADLVTTTSNSARFTEAMMGYLKSLPKGEKIYVEDIETLNLEGRIVKLQPLTFTVR